MPRSFENVNHEHSDKMLGERGCAHKSQRSVLCDASSSLMSCTELSLLLRSSQNYLPLVSRYLFFPGALSFRSTADADPGGMLAVPRTMPRTRASQRCYSVTSRGIPFHASRLGSCAPELLIFRTVAVSQVADAVR